MNLMKLNSTLSHVLNPIDKYGELIGAGIEAYRRRELLAVEITRITEGHVHFPNLQLLIENIVNQPTVKTGVATIIGGYILENAGIHPSLSKIGKIAQKLAGAAIAVTITENTLGRMTNPGYPEEYHRKVGDSIQENFQNAPLAQRYYP